MGIGSAIAQIKASEKQVAASERVAEQQRITTEQARQDLLPFRDVGVGILNQLSEFVTQGPETEFARQQGFEDIQQSAAAGRKLQSGETLQALTQFNTGLNAQFRNQRFNELFQLANLGQSSAAGVANIGIRGGENIANQIIGGANAQAAGLVGLGNALQGTAEAGFRFFGGGGFGGGGSVPAGAVA